MIYLCWGNTGGVKGVATSKKHAEKLCNEIGDCYMKVKPNTTPELDTEVTKLCTHHTKLGFLTFDEAFEKAEKLNGFN